MRFMVRSAATLLLLSASIAMAQDARVDVTLVHTGTDALGRRLASSLRGELLLNKRINLVKTSEDRIGVYLVTMATEGATIYSATWTLGGMLDDGYLTSRVGLCEEEEIRSCVRNLVTETNKHASVLYSVRHQHPTVKVPAR
jgi:hypothetical protein